MMIPDVIDYENPFSLDTVRLPPERIIDRQEQVKFLNDRVIGHRENVLITGPYGVGKTCLLRKFRAGIPKDTAHQTLLIEMEMRRVTADPSDFLSDVLLKLIGSFWEQVLKRPYSELIKSVTSPADVREHIMPQVKTVLELYRLVRPRSVTAAMEEHNALGFDKWVKATKEEKLSRTVTRGDLTPSEFVSLANQLLLALAENGISRTIIFGDEANHIDPDIETEIIRRNFEVFSQQNVQFVLTARPEVVKAVPHLKDAFPAFLEVKPFDDSSVLDDLLQVYSSGRNTPSFSPQSRRLLWQVSRGNPTEIQRLCQTCVANAISRARSGMTYEIDLDCVVAAMVQTYDFHPK